MLTTDRLRELLDYDTETGLFRWKTPTNNRITVGSLAGQNHPKGYTRIGVDGAKYLAHRLAWLYVHGVWPINQIDHINRMKTDNRINNLRDVIDGINKRNVDVVRDGQGRFAPSATRPPQI